MKVLFVCSGNSDFFPITPFIKSQGESIHRKGIEIEYFRIKGRGIWGYLRNVTLLREHLKKNKYDIIHAHYALCGLVVVLSFPEPPIAVSYMGSDVCGNVTQKGKRKFSSYINIVNAKFIQLFADWIIVKSPALFNFIHRKKKTTIVPNGVDFQKFKPISRNVARRHLRIDTSKKVILFLGDPKNTIKNFPLVKKAFNYLDSESVELLAPYPIPHERTSLYLNASDVLILSSFMEGSPNIVKEAMACDIPVVATDVGDVKLLFDEIPGYYITSFNAVEIAHKLKLATEFPGRPKGRERLAFLNLDSETVADKLISIYYSLAKKL